MALYMICILAGHRIYVSGYTDIEIKEKYIKNLLTILFICYAIFLICIQLNPEPFYMELSFINKTNFIPFHQIIAYIFALSGSKINTSTILQNIFGMILIYIPVGAILSYALYNVAKKRLFLVCLTLILLIEIVQLFTSTGVFDIDDIILGLIGCSLGFYIFKIKPLRQLGFLILGAQYPHLEGAEKE